MPMKNAMLPMKCKWVLILGIFLSSCVGGVKGRSLTELSRPEGGAKEYIVNAGDTLNVQVWGETKLSGEVLVREDGKLSMSLIGDVQAEGKTLTELSAEISKKLDAFLTAPSVSISVTQTAPIRYYLSGSFLKPGEYRSEGEITFLQAVATGGGFAPFADESSIVLIRKTKQGEFRYELDYNQVIAGKEPNPILRHGDLISVR